MIRWDVARASTGTVRTATGRGSMLLFQDPCLRVSGLSERGCDVLPNIPSIWSYDGAAAAIGIGSFLSHIGTGDESGG